MAVHAETILRNGTVWCGRREGIAQAVALWGGRVLATGPDAEIAPLIGPDTRVIDLRGRLATPGLIDAHLHLLPYGLGMLEVDARPKNAPTLDALLGLIKARAEALGPGKWVLARGYDQFKLDVKRHPWREELDRVAPDNPVHLVRTCGHISICNSKAFELAGITATTVAPPGGLIEVQNGQLTGMLAENGRDPIRKVLPAATDEELVGAIERAGQYLNSLGITSCMDAAVGMHSHFREIGAYFSAEPAAGCRCAPPCACSAIQGRKASCRTAIAPGSSPVPGTTCCASGR